MFSSCFKDQPFRIIDLNKAVNNNSCAYNTSLRRPWYAQATFLIQRPSKLCCRRLCTAPRPLPLILLEATQSRSPSKWPCCGQDQDRQQIDFCLGVPLTFRVSTEDVESISCVDRPEHRWCCLTAIFNVGVRVKQLMVKDEKIRSEKWRSYSVLFICEQGYGNFVNNRRF